MQSFLAKFVKAKGAPVVWYASKKKVL